MNVILVMRWSVSEGLENVEVEAVEDPISGEVQAQSVSVGLQSLDEVDLKDIFERRAFVMINVPLFKRGLPRGRWGRVQGNIDMELLFYLAQDDVVLT